MDAFDFADDPGERKPKTTTRGLILNLGALYFLASSFCLVGFFVYTYLVPGNPYNPFPPASQVAVAETPTFTLPPSQTSIIIPTLTMTPTFTIAPTSTRTITPTFTITPTLNLGTTDEPEGGTLTPTSTTIWGIHFIAQNGTPVYSPHPNGCDGIYLVGNVVDIEGSPLPGIVVDAGGSLGGATIDPLPSTSGDHPEFSSSGWQIKISDELIASASSVYVALYSDEVEGAISDLVFIDTYDDCDHNMIMVNFVQDQ
jgi:hypothetical protein